MIDSKHTSPDAIRALYLNPKNPLQNVEDVGGLPIAVQIAIQQPLTGLGGGGGYSSGGNSGGGGQYQYSCPAVDQWTVARVPGTLRSWIYKRMQDVSKDADYLRNPMSKEREFRRVIEKQIIRNVECVSYSTFAGAESVCSYSHLVIRDREDGHGKTINQLIEEPDVSHRTVSLLEQELEDTEIRQITSVGKMDIVAITLEGIGGGIYFCGSVPEKLNATHNKPKDGNTGFGDNEPFGTGEFL